MSNETPNHGLRISERHWAALAEIAARLGLRHGGLPSRAKALAWLVEKEEPTLTEDTTPTPNGAK